MSSMIDLPGYGNKTTPEDERYCPACRKMCVGGRYVRRKWYCHDCADLGEDLIYEAEKARRLGL